MGDRVEMHHNIGEQRDNWNTLLLNSVNMITLAASTMAGVSRVAASNRAALLAFKLSSGLLFSAATGMLVIMNKIQPSQLAEEQRNATRLFRQLQNEIKTEFAIGKVSEKDVKDAMAKVLTPDKSYPLPLLGAMNGTEKEEIEEAKGGAGCCFFPKRCVLIKWRVSGEVLRPYPIRCE